MKFSISRKANSIYAYDLYICTIMGRHNYLVILLLAFQPYNLSASNNTSRLTVVVDNIKKADGEVIITIFNKQEDFLKKYYRLISVPANEDGQVEAFFEGLPEGQYSVSVIHDENSNGELDKNLIGVPKEGFGFSNNKMGTFGPPSYKDCLVDVANKSEIKIVLKSF